MRTDVLIFISTLYSIVLALSNFLSIFFLFPPLFSLFLQRKSIIIIFKRLLMLNFFILLVTISVYFSDKNLSFLIFCRSNLILLFMLTLFFDKTYFDIARGLKNLAFPDFLISIFYFTSKFILIIFDRFKVFQKNLILRGFKQKVSFFTYKIYANFIALLFISSLKKADTLNKILIVRGFNGKMYSLKCEKKLHFKEIILALFTIISLLIGYI